MFSSKWFPYSNKSVVIQSKNIFLRTISEKMKIMYFKWSKPVVHREPTKINNNMQFFHLILDEVYTYFEGTVLNQSSLLIWNPDLRKPYSENIPNCVFVDFRTGEYPFVIEGAYIVGLFLTHFCRKCHTSDFTVYLEYAIMARSIYLVINFEWFSILILLVVKPVNSCMLLLLVILGFKK